MLNERAQYLLKSLIERYITDGQPVGSRTLSMTAGLELSAATIRHILADLEERGLIAAPHPSAGRVPTTKGYRLFVDHLLTVEPLENQALQELKHSLKPDSPQKLSQLASTLLSELTQFAGIVLTPQRPDAAFRQIEFLRLSARRVLLIFVTLEGDVQNHLLHTERDYLPDELTVAANFLNQHYAGQGLEKVALHIEDELMRLKSDIARLMATAIALARHVMNNAEDTVLIAGGSNLLHIRDFSADLNRLQELFAIFERKTDLLKLLNQSCQAQGVHIYIGEESGVMTLDDCSVVTASYQINGQVVGTLGVIGPTRMAYKRVIPIVDITARLLSCALSYKN